MSTTPSNPKAGKGACAMSAEADDQLHPSESSRRQIIVDAKGKKLKQQLESAFEELEKLNKRFNGSKEQAFWEWCKSHVDFAFPGLGEDVACAVPHCFIGRQDLKQVHDLGVFEHTQESQVRGDCAQCTVGLAFKLLSNKREIDRENRTPTTMTTTTAATTSTATTAATAAATTAAAAETTATPAASAASTTAAAATPAAAAGQSDAEYPLVIMGNLLYEHILRWPESLVDKYPDLKGKYPNMAKAVPGFKPYYQRPSEVNSRGEIDLLILDRHANVIFVQVKAFGTYTKPDPNDGGSQKSGAATTSQSNTSRSTSQRSKKPKISRWKQAYEQLDIDLKNFKVMFPEKEFSNVKVKRVIAMPNISLEDAAKEFGFDVEKLKEEGVYMLTKEDLFDDNDDDAAEKADSVPEICLPKFDNWFRRHLLTGSPNELTPDLMKIIVARYIGTLSRPLGMGLNQERSHMRTPCDSIELSARVFKTHSFFFGEEQNQAKEDLKAMLAWPPNKDYKRVHMKGPPGSRRTAVVYWKARSFLGDNSVTGTATPSPTAAATSAASSSPSPSTPSSSKSAESIKSTATSSSTKSVATTPRKSKAKSATSAENSSQAAESAFSSAAAAATTAAPTAAASTATTTATPSGKTTAISTAKSSQAEESTSSSTSSYTTTSAAAQPKAEDHHVIVVDICRGSEGSSVGWHVYHAIWRHKPQFQERVHRLPIDANQNLSKEEFTRRVRNLTGGESVSTFADSPMESVTHAAFADSSTASANTSTEKHIAIPPENLMFIVDEMPPVEFWSNVLEELVHGTFADSHVYLTDGLLSRHLGDHEQQFRAVEMCCSCRVPPTVQKVLRHLDCYEQKAEKPEGFPEQQEEEKPDSPKQQKEQVIGASESFTQGSSSGSSMQALGTERAESVVQRYEQEEEKPDSPKQQKEQVIGASESFTQGSSSGSSMQAPGTERAEGFDLDCYEQKEEKPDSPEQLKSEVTEASKSFKAAPESEQKQEEAGSPSSTMVKTLPCMSTRGPIPLCIRHQKHQSPGTLVQCERCAEELAELLTYKLSLLHEADCEAGSSAVTTLQCSIVILFSIPSNRYRETADGEHLEITKSNCESYAEYLKASPFVSTLKGLIPRLEVFTKVQAEDLEEEKLWNKILVCWVDKFQGLVRDVVIFLPSEASPGSKPAGPYKLLAGSGSSPGSNSSSEASKLSADPGSSLSSLSAEPASASKLPGCSEIKHKLPLPGVANDDDTDAAQIHGKPDLGNVSGTAVEDESQVPTPTQKYPEGTSTLSTSTRTPSSSNQIPISQEEEREGTRLNDGKIRRISKEEEGRRKTQTKKLASLYWTQDDLDRYSDWDKVNVLFSASRSPSQLILMIP